MSGGPHPNRIVSMLTDAELFAIDEWRFANRIGSRAEAMRQLISKGLAAIEVPPGKAVMFADLDVMGICGTTINATET